MKAVAQALKESGGGGCTVYPVRGYGEEWHVYEPLVHGGQHKIEVIVEDDRVKRAVREITERASTGVQGDGILAVFGLDRVVHLRTKKAIGNLIVG